MEDEERIDKYTDNEKEIIVACPNENQGSSLLVNAVVFQGCGDTHVGNETSYYDEVQIENTVEMSTDQFISSQALIAFPSTSSGLYHENGINYESGNSEIQPLITKKTQGESRRIQYILVIVVCSLILTLIPIIIVYGHVTADYNNPGLPANFTHYYRDRNAWSSLKPKHKIPNFKFFPPPFVIVSHTVTNACNVSTNCAITIQNIQVSQMVGPFDDIAYNFLVAGDGLIYEGRGWEKKSASTTNMGCSSMAVAFVGTFSHVVPPQNQLDAFALLMDTAERYGKLKKNYKMFMQSDVIQSESPGKMLSAILKEWPHWQPFSQQDLLCND